MQQESATLDSARYDLSKVRIESPIDGIVTRRNIEEGETVVVGTMNNAGTVLLTIADMSVIEAEVEVDETDIPSVQFGQKAKITIDAMPGKTFTAQRHRNRQQPDSRRRAAAAGGIAGDELQGRRHAGWGDSRSAAGIHVHRRDHDGDARQRASRSRSRPRPCARWSWTTRATSSASPRAGRRAARLAAVQASELKPGQSRKELEGVFVVRDSKAIFEPVKTGIAGEKYFEMLSGLKEGEQVVVGPFSSVRELADGAARKVEAAPARRPTAGDEAEDSSR